MIAVVETAVDADAFIGGLQLGLGAAFLLLVALGGVAIVRRVTGA